MDTLVQKMPWHRSATALDRWFESSDFCLLGRGGAEIGEGKELSVCDNSIALKRKIIFL